MVSVPYLLPFPFRPPAETFRWQRRRRSRVPLVPDGFRDLSRRSGEGEDPGCAGEEGGEPLRGWVWRAGGDEGSMCALVGRVVLAGEVLMKSCRCDDIRGALIARAKYLCMTMSSRRDRIAPLCSSTSKPSNSPAVGTRLPCLYASHQQLLFSTRTRSDRDVPSSRREQTCRARAVASSRLSPSATYISNAETSALTSLFCPSSTSNLLPRPPAGSSGTTFDAASTPSPFGGADGDGRAGKRDAIREPIV